MGTYRTGILWNISWWHTVNTVFLVQHGNITSWNYQLGPCPIMVPNCTAEDTRQYLVWDKEGSEDTTDHVCSELFTAAENGDDPLETGRGRSKKRKDKKGRKSNKKKRKVSTSSSRSSSSSSSSEESRIQVLQVRRLYGFHYSSSPGEIFTIDQVKLIWIDIL